MIRKLLEEAARQNRNKRDPLVIAAVVDYFNLGPAPHGLFYNTVHQIAHSFYGEWFFESRHTVAPVITNCFRYNFKHRAWGVSQVPRVRPCVSATNYRMLLHVEEMLLQIQW